MTHFETDREYEIAKAKALLKKEGYAAVPIEKIRSADVHNLVDSYMYDRYTAGDEREDYLRHLKESLAAELAYFIAKEYEMKVRDDVASYREAKHISMRCTFILD